MVALTFRTTDIWGSGKGGPLDAAEIDTNFHNINVKLGELETGDSPANIDSIVVSGSQMTITLDDLRVFGPYTLPRSAFRWRGNWAAATAYVGNDVIKVPGQGLYLVNYDHTSGASFDAALVVSPETEPALILMFAGDNDPVTAVNTATYTPGVAIPFGYFRFTLAGGCTVTIPPESSEDFAVGSELRLTRRDSSLDVIAGAGVTLNVPTGFTADAAHVGAVITAKKVATDEWDLFGDLASV